MIFLIIQKNYFVNKKTVKTLNLKFWKIFIQII